MTITHKSKLPIGILYDGKTLKDFAVRPLLVRDSVEAIEELGADCPQVRLRIAQEARQVTIEGIPREAHTVDLLLGMYDKDYAAITTAIEVAEKKLLAQSEP